MMSPRTAVLDLPKMIPVIRQAITDQYLQIYNMNGFRSCLYAGPCAIGVCLRVNDRSYFDDANNSTFSSTSVYSWIRNDHSVPKGTEVSKFVVAEGTDISDLTKLQDAHDDGNIQYFEKVFAEIEAKYEGR